MVDSGNRRIRRVDLASAARTVSTWAGGLTMDERNGEQVPVGEATYAIGREARFHRPTAIAFGPKGAHILDRGDGRLRFAAPAVPGRPDEAGLVVTVGGGNDKNKESADGPALMARLRDPPALAVAPDGRVFVGDPGNHVLRAWLPGGWFVGLARSAAMHTAGLAIEPGPNPRTLWVADGEARTISRVALP